MPFNFSGQVGHKVAKLGVVSDGEVFTVGADGYTLTSTMSPFSIFAAPPSRSATGVWSVTTKDQVVIVIDWDVKTILPSSNYLGAQLNTVTTVSGTGQAVLHWTFNTAGTPADLPASGQFVLYVQYSETSV